MPPQLDQQTIKEIEDAIDELVVVTYRVSDSENAQARGRYRGPAKNGRGEWCVEVVGAHECLIRIPTMLVVKVERK
jgi:hypothetical protein